MPIGADPHVERLDGFAFDFKGIPGRTYRILERGDTQIRCTLVAIPGIGSSPPRTIMGDVTITVGQVTVAIPLDRQIRVWSPEFDFSIHALLCTLPAHNPTLDNPNDHMNAIPYINADILRRPTSFEGMSGLLIDGDDSDECEARERLHG